MNKNNCEVNQKVAYFPEGRGEKTEFGIVTELRDNWAMVLYEGNTISKATHYADLEAVPKTLAPIGKSNNNDR
jgi:hypothetical protein